MNLSANDARRMWEVTFLLLIIILDLTMKGTTLRIIVHEPSDWSHGNLFGTVISDKGSEMLLVEVSSAFGHKLISDRIEFRSRNGKESFKALMQYYSLMVDGIFVDQDGNKMNYSMYGSITID